MVSYHLRAANRPSLEHSSAYGAAAHNDDGSAVDDKNWNNDGDEKMRSRCRLRCICRLYRRGRKYCLYGRRMFLV